MNLGNELSEIWEMNLPTEEITLVEFLSGIRVKQLEVVAGVNTGENVKYPGART